MATTIHDAAGSDPILQLRRNGANTERFEVAANGSININSGEPASARMKLADRATSGNAYTLTIEGSDATTGDNNGGDIILTPGTGSGSGDDGRVGIGIDPTLYGKLVVQYDPKQGRGVADATVLAYCPYDTDGGAGVVWADMHYGQNNSDATGTAHGISTYVTVHDCGAAGGGDFDEMAAYFGCLKADTSASTAGDAIRLWGIDLGVQGPYQQQAQWLIGLSNVVNNYHNSTPSLCSAGAVVMTAPNTGPGVHYDPYPTPRATYPLEVGIGICGFSNTNANRQTGFSNALQIGGALSWMDALGGRSRFDTGIDLSDYEDYGLYIHDRYSGATGPAIAVTEEAGFVGFGTTSPKKSLHIAKATGNYTYDDLLVIDSVNGGAGNGGGIAFYANQSGSFHHVLGRIKALDADGWDGRFDFQVSNGTGRGDSQVTAMSLVGPEGNVGIGTTNPGALLEVRKDQVGETLLKVTNDTDDSGALVAVELGIGGTSNHPRFQHSGGESGTTELSFRNQFQLRRRGDPNPTIFGAFGGNVGIGTTSPNEKLDVQGDIEFGTENVKLSTGSGAPSGGSDGDLYVRVDGANTGLHINVNGTWKKCDLS